jgi:hypothetical protein
MYARGRPLKNGALPFNYRKPLDVLGFPKSADQKQKATSRVKSGLSNIRLHRMDEFRNCFLYGNLLEINPQFQAVELAIAGT